MRYLWFSIHKVETLSSYFELKILFQRSLNVISTLKILFPRSLNVIWVKLVSNEKQNFGVNAKKMFEWDAKINH